MVVQTDTHQKVIRVSIKRICNGYSRESGIKIGFVLWTKTSRVSEVLSSSRVITSYHSSLDISVWAGGTTGFISKLLLKTSPGVCKPLHTFEYSHQELSAASLPMQVLLN